MYDAEDGTVDFAHHTVLQYLVARSPSQHPSLLATDFRPDVVDTYIGEVCLAYLSFSDFETQLEKLPGHVELQHETAEELLWWGIPFAPKIRKAVAWARPLSRHSQRQSAQQRPMSIPVYIKPSKIWTRKYVLQDYVIAHWTFHTAALTKNSPIWITFRHIALERELLFEVRPWSDSQHHAKVEEVLDALQVSSGTLFDREWRRDNIRIMHIYAWAMANGAAALFTLLDPQQLRPYLDIALAAMYPGKVKSKVAPSEAFVSLFKTMLRKPISPRPLQLGLWNGALIYWLATHVELNFREVIDRYYEEYDRWVKPDVLSFDVFGQDAISIAAKQVDTSAFLRLIDYHIDTYEELLSTIACLTLRKQLNSGIILRLLSIELPHAKISPRLEIELIHALQGLLPAIQTALEVNWDALLHVSAAIDPLLLVAALTSDHTGHPILVSTALKKYIDVLPRLKGPIQDAIFAKEKSTERLSLLRSKNQNDLCRSLIAYTALARDVMFVDRLNESYAFRMSCTCYLGVLSGLFFCENELYLDSEDHERLALEIMASYEGLHDCVLHTNTKAGKMLSRKFLRWSITAPDIVWQRVIPLWITESDLKHLLQIGVEKARSLNQKDMIRLSQLASRHFTTTHSTLGKLQAPSGRMMLDSLEFAILGALQTRF